MLLLHKSIVDYRAAPADLEALGKEPRSNATLRSGEGTILIGGDVTQLRFVGKDLASESRIIKPKVSKIHRQILSKS